MKSPVLAFLCFVSFLAEPLLGAELLLAPTCNTYLGTLKGTPENNELPISRVVQLRLSQNTIVKAAFLGLKKNKYYFYNLSSHNIMEINDLNFSSADSNPKAQNMIKINGQSAMQCALYSMIHGLRLLFLSDTYLKAHQKLKAILDEDPSTLEEMDRLFGSKTPTVFDIPFFKVVFSLSGLEGIGPFESNSQVVARRKFLRSLNIKTKVTRSFQSVRENLNTKAPVILDGTMVGAQNKIYGEDGGLIGDGQRTIPFAGGGSRHSVVAFGHFADSNNEGYTIVFDSIDGGTFYVWSDSELKFFLESSKRNKALILEK
jgi:hypothetical protein